MAMRVNDSKLSGVVELISKRAFSGMAEAMQILLNEAMLVERARYLQASPYEGLQSNAPKKFPILHP